MIISFYLSVVPAFIPAGASRQAALVEALLPHLRRVLGILLDGETQVIQSQVTGNQNLPAPVFYLDRDARVVGMTDAARHLADSFQDVWVSDEGALMVSDKDVQSAMADAVRTAVGKDWSRTLRTGAEIAMHTKKGDGLFLIITPVSADAIVAARAKVQCAVLVLAAMPTNAATIRRLQRLFGLTPAQCEVAAGVADGESIDCIAKRRGTSVLTVRTQLKHVYGKTGSRTQAELAGLVHRLR